ncbi:uncharacterized protein [Periplaneta americana]|uniref:uncharacterized protein isoform X2 n=1 Tax=Periplaneta americana TaxID=6978 RepID=UPI0037E8311C
MPRRCCVPGCRSNYDSTLKSSGKYVSAFSFPKDENRRQAWIHAISRKDWTPSPSSTVCIKHFDEKEVNLHDIYRQPDGTLTKLLLNCPRLSKDAVPSKFENLTLNTRKPNQRNKLNRDCRRKATGKLNKKKEQKPKGVRRKRDIRPDHIYALRDIGLQRASGARQPYLKRGRHSTSKQSIMPDSCCANGCTNRRVKGGNIQFFTFPFKDQERLKKWIAAVRRRNFLPTRHSRICSEHFRKEDYLVRPNINVPRLNSSAVPSIFHAHPKKATRKTRNRRKKLCDTTSENVFTTPQKKLDFGQIESSIKREISGVSESSQEHRLEENENNYEEDPLSSKDDENKIKYETESSQILDLDLNSGETMETDSITVKCEALEEVGVIIKEENESLDSYPSDDVQMPFPVVKCENVEEYQYADIVDINNIKQEYPYADIVDISNIKQEATEGQDLVLDGLSSYPA